MNTNNTLATRNNPHAYICEHCGDEHIPAPTHSYPHASDTEQPNLCDDCGFFQMITDLEAEPTA